MRLWRSSTLTAKVLTTFSVLAVAGGLAGLGTYATWTSSATASHSISSGTVTIALGAVGPANRLTVNATGIVPGDTMQRAFNLSDTGSANLASVTLTTSATTSTTLDTDATNGLQMVIDKCSVAWTESGPPYTYTCSGTTSSVLASRAVIGSTLALSNITDLLTAGTTDYLRLTLTLPSTAPNGLQGLTSTIQYAFTGTQRAGAAA